MQAEPEVSSPGRRFFGYVLMTAGGLLTLLSGTCTLAWLGSIVVFILHSARPSAGVAPALLLALPFGGVPIAAGVAMIVGGRSLLKPSRPPPLPASPLQ